MIVSHWVRYEIYAQDKQCPGIFSGKAARVPDRLVLWKCKRNETTMTERIRSLPPRMLLTEIISYLYGCITKVIVALVKHAALLSGRKIQFLTYTRRRHYFFQLPFVL